MKKTIKINFKYLCDGFNPENNLFTNLLREKYNVIISDNPDYLFYSVYPEIKPKTDISKKGDFIKKISPTLYVFTKKIYSKISNFSLKDKFPFPEGDFVRVFWGLEHTKPDMSKCDWAFSSYPEEEINNSRYLRIPIYRVDYPFNQGVHLPLKRKIDFNKIKKEKTRFCNFIYAQEIPERNKFFRILSKYKKIDAPGRCMNNMPPISHKNPRESRLFPNWAKAKVDFIKKYKFTIAFENVTKNGWTTEKLTHSLLVNSIPIYFGNKNVGKDFNTKCFINANDFKNMHDLINHIIKVDNDDELYKKYLEEPIFKTKEQYYFSRDERIKERLYKIIESNNKTE